MKMSNGDQINPIYLLDFTIGKIVDVKNVTFPTPMRPPRGGAPPVQPTIMYQIVIDIAGTYNRTINNDLAYYGGEPGPLVGQKIVLFSNANPRPMMLETLDNTDPTNIDYDLLSPDGDVNPGVRLTYNGVEINGTRPAGSTVTVDQIMEAWAIVLPNLKTDTNGYLTYSGEVLMTPGNVAVKGTPNKSVF